MIVYWIFRLIILLGRPFPPKVGYFVARISADICYVFFSGKRHALKAAMARVLDTDDEKAISLAARSSFRNFGKYIVDFIHFLDSTPEEVRRRMVFDDELERIQAVMAEKKASSSSPCTSGTGIRRRSALSLWLPSTLSLRRSPYKAMNALIQAHDAAWA
jgi:hypothetical protein